jgi:FK506-binding nuclear protein
MFPQHYQQPLDITVGENERVCFKVTGTHTIYLTGNYVIEADAHDHNDDEEDYSDEEMDYDMSPDEDELEGEDDEDDLLDSLKDPRITEVDSEEEAPKLVKAAKTKGKNKRPADDSDDEQAVTLDDLIAKSMKPEPATNGEQKLSKKQLKKLKKNNGEATPAAVETPAKEDAKKEKDTPNSAKSDKKVQFAKNLEQGPTGSPLANGKNGAKKEETKGPKVIQGVTIDDKKVGKGPAAKKGDKIGMRYIGKLKDGKVFDCKHHTHRNANRPPY